MVEIYNNFNIPSHKFTQRFARSTHRMQIISKSRFQFPHWVMKNVLFPKVITIFKLIYLLWFKIEQTLPGFGVTRFTSASASACFSGADPGFFFRRGCTRLLLYFKINKPHSFFFAEYQLY